MAQNLASVMLVGLLMKFGNLLIQLVVLDVNGFGWKDLVSALFVVGTWLRLELARKVLLGVGYLFLAVMLWILIAGIAAENPSVMIGGREIPDPKLVNTITIFVVVSAGALFGIMLLHTSKAREDFRRNRTPQDS